MGLWERENHLLGFIKGRKVADKYYIKKLMGGLKWGRQKKESITGFIKKKKTIKIILEIKYDVNRNGF